MGRPVVHWELWSKDPERLSEFYTAVFGWRIQHIPEMSYRLADTGSGRGIGGGIMRPQEGPWPGNMTMYVDVEELAATLRAVEAAGGKVVVERLDLPGVGAMALFEDPDGRVLGLWRQDSGGAEAKPATPSDIYPALTYDNAAAAIDWLCRAFGFEKRLVVEGEGGRIEHSELSLGTGVVMVSSPKPEQGRVGPRSLGGRSVAISVSVVDPDAHHAAAVAAGAHILRPLQDEEYGGRGYMAEDLEGYTWYFGGYRPGEHWQR